jgi:hypothetical protein
MLTVSTITEQHAGHAKKAVQHLLKKVNRFVQQGFSAELVAEIRRDIEETAVEGSESQIDLLCKALWAVTEMDAESVDTYLRGTIRDEKVCLENMWMNFRIAGPYVSRILCESFTFFDYKYKNQVMAETLVQVKKHLEAGLLLTTARDDPTSLGAYIAGMVQDDLLPLDLTRNVLELVMQYPQTLDNNLTFVYECFRLTPRHAANETARILDLIENNEAVLQTARVLGLYQVLRENL